MKIYISTTTCPSNPSLNLSVIEERKDDFPGIYTIKVLARYDGKKYVPISHYSKMKVLRNMQNLNLSFKDNAFYPLFSVHS